MNTLRIWIPLLPPGINASYGVGNRKGKADMYKTNEALIWQRGAALIIGSEAARQNWADDSKYYEIVIKFSNWNMDADGPIKLVIDTVATKLGFNDKRILKQSSEKIKSEEKGVWIELKPYEQSV